MGGTVDYGDAYGNPGVDDDFDEDVTDDDDEFTYDELHDAYMGHLQDAAERDDGDDGLTDEEAYVAYGGAVVRGHGSPSASPTEDAFRNLANSARR